MTVYQTVTLTIDDWVDLNTAAGVAVGGAFRIQNIGSNACYLIDAAAKPTQPSGILLLTAQFDELSIADVESGSERVWVMPSSPNKTIRLMVSD